MKIEVLFYDLPNGEEPVKVFLDSLDHKMRAKMLREIELLENNGPELREPDSKNIGDGIFELRAKIGSDISRVLYFFFIGRRAILTNGFVKKTQKTPEGEIDKARRYRAEYLSREAKQHDKL
ncbi:MAG: type II toxin-antitoxin system RelE/ParE family toxin [Clostridia bacterium]|nr:type II toxin-antitoxin system RelE/ParE family toxin [Clostridia bacterium]